MKDPGPRFEVLPVGNCGPLPVWSIGGLRAACHVAYMGPDNPENGRDEGGDCFSGNTLSEDCHCCEATGQHEQGKNDDEPRYGRNVFPVVRPASARSHVHSCRLCKNECTTQL